jgi:predicted amidophosphoribosyltransferase
MWNETPARVIFQDVPTFSTVAYSPQVSSVVLKAKEERNVIAQHLLAKALHGSITALIKSERISKFLVVPIPSSPSALRKRGESFLHPILNQVILINSYGNENWKWQEMLRHRKKVRDQAGLNSRQRKENLAGVFQLRNAHSTSLPIILVDDVITTGSTLRNAFLALNERKMTVLGAATACASPHQFPIR